MALFSMEALAEQVTKYRRDLHQIPELDFDLPKTLAYLKEVLKDFPCEVFSPDGKALCAYFDAGKPRTVAFRTDMDALPVTEVTGVDFCSRHPGQMHACGHDGHMAMVLGLANLATVHLATLPRNVLLVFQPAEETSGGAQFICQSGVFRERNVDCIYGFHLWPDLPKGQAATRSGALLARASEVNVTIEGVSTHIAKYESGDALLAAAQFIVEVDTIIENAKKDDPYTLLKFGKIEAGRVRNVICNHAVIQGSLRVFSDEMFERCKREINEMAERVAQATGTKVAVEFTTGYPPVINDAALFEAAQVTIPELETLPKPLLIAEDFAFYQQTLPGLFILLGTGTGIPLHSDEFNFDESVLMKGVDIYKRLMLAPV